MGKRVNKCSVIKETESSTARRRTHSPHEARSRNTHQHNEDKRTTPHSQLPSCATFSLASMTPRHSGYDTRENCLGFSYAFINTQLIEKDRFSYVVTIDLAP
ncbi:hypothetical protein E2C01_041612 [Portunus trituberculatus]|uniref:Uncharacterized protein n=1 Tax=Portunus trituberculatus TaxID=210409 RepID=A0A5B7FS60_PORTR|nr:hypothetical protein [Portunus trituberculatus]